MKSCYNSIDRTRARTIAMSAICLLSLSGAADAPRPYHNEEWGIHVTFPAGSTVCEARSGDHPHGFYAWYGGRSTDCRAVRPDPSASAVGIYASYNTSFETSANGELPCRNGTAPRGSSISLRGLAFPRLNSVTCAIRRRDGSLEFVVAAQAGTWGPGASSPEFTAPHINYRAFLSTRPAHAARDLAMFREFLAHIVIQVR
jgi:hypothetical protein